MALFNTQVIFFLLWEVNETESDPTRFVCVSPDGLCVSCDAIYVYTTVVRQTGLAIGLAGEKHQRGGQLS